MSSIIVKGMKMPECCGTCKLSAQVSMSLGAVMRCRLVGVVGTSASDPHDVFNKRHPNCPLVALPDKHGRLIDENDVMVSQKECGEVSSCQECRMHVSCCADMEDVLKNAPTIVESEGEP